MPNIERRLPRIAALAAPAFVWFAAACDNGKPVPKNTPIPPTAEGQVGAAVTNPTIAPAIETIEPKTARRTTLIKSGAREYELYTDTTIDQIIETADSLEASNSKESIINNLQSIKTILEMNPADTAVIISLNSVVKSNNANCQGDTSREITKQIASWVHQNHPEKYAQNSAQYEQGNCSVTGENQVVAPTPKSNEAPSNPTNLEPWTHRFGGEVNTAFKGNYAYAYTLPRIDTPKDAIISLRSFITSPELDSYVADSQKRDAMTKLYDVALDKASANPSDPEIAIQVLQASTLLREVCTTGFHRTTMNYNAAVIKRVSPELWQQNQFSLLESNCFNAKKFVISPEFKIYPFENGTFIYEGVTYDDVLSYAQKIRQIYPRDSGTIISWLQHASDNRGTAEEDNGLNSASFILQGGCKDNDVAFNLIRLMASVKGSKDQDSLDLLRLRACYISFFNDEYFFER